jgi:uncharacterized protein (UPF0261 family)
MMVAVEPSPAARTLLARSAQAAPAALPCWHQPYGSLPVGLPKLLVTTVASSNIAACVGTSDLWLVPSMTGVQGLNRISRWLLGNAAHALAGMLFFSQGDNAVQSRPVVGSTMFEVTRPACRARVPRRRHDCIVFRAAGTGDQAMERLIASGLLTGALDVTTTEICDLQMGGISPRRGVFSMQVR